MRAQATARMSALSAVAMVGIETMKTRVATPERSCPVIALTRSSRSVCLAIRPERGHCRTGLGTMAPVMPPILFDQAFQQRALTNLRAFERRALDPDGHRPAAVAVVLL